MELKSVELGVGIFVLIGLLCVGYLTVTLGEVEFLKGKHYFVSASFHSVSGLKEGANVEMAGVPVGEVDDISLELDRRVARVRLKVQSEVKLAEDVIASVKTSGLIGDKYIQLTPGGSMETIEPGGVITETESAIDIEELVSKYVFGSV